MNAACRTEFQVCVEGAEIGAGGNEKTGTAFSAWEALCGERTGDVENEHETGVNSSTGSRDGERSAERCQNLAGAIKHKGSLSSPLKNVACFVVIGISGVLFLFDRPFPSAIASGNRSYIGSKEQTDFFGR